MRPVELSFPRFALGPEPGGALPSVQRGSAALLCVPEAQVFLEGQADRELGAVEPAQVRAALESRRKAR